MLLLAVCCRQVLMLLLVIDPELYNVEYLSQFVCECHKRMHLHIVFQNAARLLLLL